MSGAQGREQRHRAAAQYRPRHTRLLIIAESPPKASDRYFYFEDVRAQDSLWVEIMKALYAPEFGATALERSRKGLWLSRFRDDGCFLIDAVKDPLSGPSSQRVAIIRRHAPSIVREVRAINPEAVLLIKATAWEAISPALDQAGVPLMNRGPIPFPGSGRQRQFRQALDDLGVRRWLLRPPSPS